MRTGKFQNDASTTGFWSELRELYALSPSPRRRQFALLLGLMLLGTVAELATIGAALPFIAALADQQLAPAFGALATTLDPLVAATAVFIALVLVAGAIRLQLAWSTRSFVTGLGHDLAVEVQRRTLNQPYSFHIGHNSSTLIAALDKVQALVFDVLLLLMQGGIALFMALSIIAALIVIDPMVALAAVAGFATFYLLLSAFTAPRLARNSTVLRSAYDDRVKIVQESLGGIRDVIIDGSQHVFVGAFEQADRRFSTANASTGFLASAPRFIIEAAGTAVIAIVALAVARRDGSIAAALPALGALAIGAQRLLPLVQQVYNAWSHVSGRRSIVTQVVALLRLPVDEGPSAAALPALPFGDRITLEGVGFSYPSRAAPALDAVSFDIPCGSCIGLVGRTGSGKSTLADLLMGLLEPTEGFIAVDGVRLDGSASRRWRRSIAHVPQAIFLADDTIARNIAFGLPDSAIDMERVVDSARCAQLHEVIAALPDGYDTCVGERGIRLSGGQRQRLGIARALYRHAPVLVLDEATSALDEETEQALMASLMDGASSRRTMIIIAHRPSTVARCDMVVRLENGRITACGSPAELRVRSAG